MASIINNDSQTDYHQLNTGQTVLPVKFSVIAANASHGAGHAISDAVEPIAGATRLTGYSARITSVVLRNSVSVGTPSQRDCILYIASRQGVPATALSAGTAVTLTQLDAEYIVCAIPFSSSEYVRTSRVAVVTKTVNVDFINEDLTTSNNLYAFLVHSGSTHTYASGERFDITIFIQQN